MKELIQQIQGNNPLPGEWWSDTVFVFNCDTMQLLDRMKMNGIRANLAVSDPPYGIGESGKSNHSRGKNTKKGSKSKAKAKSTKFTPKEWDEKPMPPEFFSGLFEASDNQVIWGANHFIENLPKQNTPCWIVWDKMNGDNDFADCELAWTSFPGAVRLFKFLWNGMLQGYAKAEREKRIHPTQKPVRLYDWIFLKYAKPEPGFIVIDTHLGSASSAIAAQKFGCGFVGCEIDPDYYKDGKSRFKSVTSQKTFFEKPAEFIDNSVQISFF